MIAWLQTTTPVTTEEQLGNYVEEKEGTKEIWLEYLKNQKTK